MARSRGARGILLDNVRRRRTHCVDSAHGVAVFATAEGEKIMDAAFYFKTVAFLCDCRKLGLNDEQAYQMSQLIVHKLEEPCDECGHAEHRGACEHERGDQEIDGCLVAMGPCGCKGWTK